MSFHPRCKHGAGSTSGRCEHDEFRVTYSHTSGWTTNSTHASLKDAKGAAKNCLANHYDVRRAKIERRKITQWDEVWAQDAPTRRRELE